MDKYEFNIKLEQINKLKNRGDFETCVKIADTIDWRRVKKWSILQMVSECYEAAGKIEEARDLRVIAYNKSMGGKKNIYKMAELYVKTGDFDDAYELYEEYIDNWPKDTARLNLLYTIKYAKGAPYTELIPILEEYLEEDLDDKIMYELAELYEKTGRIDDCIKKCDEIFLWFGSGIYVDAALEMKQAHAELSESQKMTYDTIDFDMEDDTEEIFTDDDEDEEEESESEDEEMHFIADDEETEISEIEEAQEIEETPLTDEELLAEETAEIPETGEISEDEEIAETKEIEDSEETVESEEIFETNEISETQEPSEIEETLETPEISGIEEAEREVSAALEPDSEEISSKETDSEETDSDEIDSEESETEDSDDDTYEEDKMADRIEILGKFMENPDLKDQLIKLFEGIDQAMESGEGLSSMNIIVSGNGSVDRNELVSSIIKCLFMENGKVTRKIAKINGDMLNKKGITKVKDKIQGTVLIIESAGSANITRIDELLNVMEDLDEPPFVVLEDAGEKIDILLRRNPLAEYRFKSRIILAEYSVNDMVTIAREYAKERGYVITDKSLLQLYLIIDTMHSGSGGIDNNSIKEIIDKAISKSQRRSINRILSKLPKAINGKGVLTLTESDFM